MDIIYLVSKDGIMTNADIAFLCMGKIGSGNIWIKSAPVHDIYPIGRINQLLEKNPKNIKEVLLDACLAFYPELFDYKAATRTKLKELNKGRLETTVELMIDEAPGREWQQLRKDAMECIAERYQKLSIFAIDLNEKSPKFEHLSLV